MQQTPQPDLPLPLLDHLVRMFGRRQRLQPEPEGVFEGGQGFLYVVRMSLRDRNWIVLVVGGLGDERSRGGWV